MRTMIMSRAGLLRASRLQLTGSEDVVGTDKGDCGGCRVVTMIYGVPTDLSRSELGSYPLLTLSFTSRRRQVHHMIKWYMIIPIRSDRNVGAWWAPCTTSLEARAGCHDRRKHRLTQAMCWRCTNYVLSWANVPSLTRMSIFHEIRPYSKQRQT